MRLLLLLIIAGIAAWYTNPTRDAHEEQARVLLDEGAPAPSAGFTLDDVIGYAKGMLAGEGRYESYFLASKYTVDMPGSSFVECYGAYTFVNCRVVEPSEAAGDADAG